MNNPILRALLWLLAILCWIDVFLGAVTYAQAPTYVVWPAIALTAALVWTSERVRRWLS